MHIELEGVPVLTWSPPPLMHCIKSLHVMSSPVVTLPPLIKVKDLIGVLGSCSHHGFPVVLPGTEDVSCWNFNALFCWFLWEQYHITVQTIVCAKVDKGAFGKFQGLISWSQLLVLLKNKAFVETMTPTGSHLPLCVFTDAYPNYGKVEVNSEHLNGTAGTFAVTHNQVSTIFCRMSSSLPRRWITLSTYGRTWIRLPSPLVQ